MYVLYKVRTKHFAILMCPKLLCHFKDKKIINPIRNHHKHAEWKAGVCVCVCEVGFRLSFNKIKTHTNLNYCFPWLKFVTLFSFQLKSTGGKLLFFGTTPMLILRFFNLLRRTKFEVFRIGIKKSEQIRVSSLAWWCWRRMNEQNIWYMTSHKPQLATMPWPSAPPKPHLIRDAAFPEGRLLCF